MLTRLLNFFGFYTRTQREEAFHDDPIWSATDGD